MYYVTCTLCLTAVVTIPTASLMKLQYDMDKMLDRLLTSARFQKITDRIADRAAERVVRLQDNLASISDENYEEEENEEKHIVAIEDKEMRDTKVLARKALPKLETKDVKGRKEISTLDQKFGVKDDLTNKSEKTNDEEIDLNNILSKILEKSPINLTGLSSQEISLNYKRLKAINNKQPCSSVFDLKDEIQIDTSPKNRIGQGIDLLGLLKSKTDDEDTDAINEQENNSDTLEIDSEFETTEQDLDYMNDSVEKNTDEYVNMAWMNAGVPVGDSKDREDDSPEYADSSRNVESQNLVTGDNEEHKDSD